MATSVLEFLITAKDEASGALNSIANKAPQIGAAFLAAGTAIEGALALSVKAAEDAQVKMANVTATLNTMGNVSQATRTKLLSAADATLKLGFDNEEAALSIAKLYQRTGDLTQAIDLNKTAMDLARAKHLDLATASNMVGLVLSGNSRVLKQYGIDLKEAGSPLEALGELSQKVGGQSAAFADTLAGKTEILNQQIGELEERIGEKLIPLLTKLLANYIIPLVEKIIAWTDANPELTQKLVMLAAVIGGLMIILGAVLLALPVLTTLFGALNPVVLLVIAIIVALGVAVNNVVQIVLLLQDHWQEVWEGIKIMAKETIDALVGYFQPLINVLQTVYNTLSNVLSLAKGVIGGAIRSVVTSIAGARAAGGSVEGGSSYLVGENGPEIFTAGSNGYITPNSGVGGGQSITVNINGAIFSEDAANQLGKIIMNRLQRMSRVSVQ